MRFTPLGAARLALLLPLSFLPVAAHAANYTVTNEADSGTGSLRDAITLANANAGSDTVEITVDVHNIQLASALPTITDTVTIAPTLGITPPYNQKNITIARSATASTPFRFFTVASGVQLNLSNVKLDGGASASTASSTADDGGLVSNSGTFHAVGCILVNGNGARGGLIYSTGSLQVFGCYLAGGFAVEGGDIYSSGDALIFISGVTQGTTLKADPQVVTKGGGIYSSGSLTIDNATVETNSADEGAGVYIADNADLTTNQSTLNASTIANNSAAVNGGGIWLESGAVNMDSVTIAHNHAPQSAAAGLYAPGNGQSKISLANTILGDNQLPNATTPGLDLILGSQASVSLVSNDYNIFGASSGTFTPVAHDQVGVTSAQLALSDLSQVGTYGRTITPLPGSVALDKGNTTFSSDQLLLARPQAGLIDVGAVEVETPPIVHAVTVDGRVGGFVNAPLGGQSAQGLRSTFSLVSGTLPPGLRIENSSGSIFGLPTAITKSTKVLLQASNLYYTSAPFEVTFTIREAQNLYINDSGDNTNTDVSDFDGVTNLREAVTYANLYHTPVTIYSYLASGDRTIVLNAALPKITNSLNLSGPTTGGGLTIERNPIKGTPRFRLLAVSNGVTLNLANLTLSGGDAFTESGGAILNDNGTVNLSNCTLSGNTGAQGGAVASKGGASSTNLTNCTLTGNTATKPVDIIVGGGGALYNGDGNMSLISSTVVGNYALAGLSAGIASSPSPGLRVTVDSSIIAGNLIRGTTKPGIDVAVLGATGNSSTFVSSGHNLIGDGNAAVNFNKTGDHTNVADADLHLEALADNGGPTKTIALRTDSPAYNTGGTAQPLSTDQRGLPRVFGSAQDVGAYELQADTTPSITALTLTPAQPFTDDPLHATVTVTTPDQSVPTLKYVWTRTRAGVTDILPETTDTLQTAGSVVVVGDIITVTVTATSGLGESSKQAGVTIFNSPIKLVGFKLQPRAVYSNDIMIANIQTSDVDRTPTLYTYIWTKNGVVTRTIKDSKYAQDSYNLKTEGNGDHGDVIGVTVSATDGSSTVTAKGSSTVLNTVPVLSGLTLAPTAPTPSQTITATYGGHDADPGDKIKPIYHWKIGKKDLPAEMGSRLDLSKYSFVKPGDVVTCAARVTDGDALSKTLTATVTVVAPGTAPLTAPLIAPVVPSGNAS